MRARSVCGAVVVLPAFCVAAAADTGIYGPLQLQGTAAFLQRTVEALSLLKERAPDAYEKVTRFGGVIAIGEHSGMWAYEEPPRYEVGEPTWSYSVTWYASTIADDATHSELCHGYLEEHPDEAVPWEA